MNNDSIRKLFLESIEVKKSCIEAGFDSLYKVGADIAKGIKKGNKVMFCGNGGSAADAQHLVAELLIRLRPKYNRPAIPALSLAQDSSTITACGNDYSFDDLFSRVLEAIGKKGDFLIVLSTSGNSKNIINVLNLAKKMGVYTFGFLGCDGGKAIKLCDSFFLVPSQDTGRIQESHITAGHALMEYIEDALLEADFFTLNDGY